MIENGNNVANGSSNKNNSSSSRARFLAAIQEVAAIVIEQLSYVAKDCTTNRIQSTFFSTVKKFSQNFHPAVLKV